MKKPTGPTNPELGRLAAELKKQKTAFHAQLAKHLEKPARAKSGVTLEKISRSSMEGDSVFVPGKVLSGALSKKVDIYACSYSAEAKKNIAKAGGRALYLKDAAGIKGRIIV